MPTRSHQREKVAEVAHTPVCMLPPEGRIRPEHMLQMLQQLCWEGLVSGLHEAAGAGAGLGLLLLHLLAGGCSACTLNSTMLGNGILQHLQTQHHPHRVSVAAKRR